MKGIGINRLAARSWAIILVVSFGLVAVLVYTITQVTAGGSGAHPGTGTETRPFHVAAVGPEYADQYQLVDIKALAPLKSGTATRAQVTVTSFSESGTQVSKEKDAGQIQQIFWHGNTGKIRLTVTTSTSATPTTTTLDFRGSEVKATGDELADTGCENWSRAPIEASSNQPTLTAARSLTCNP